jgi:hypothetical protein
MRVLLAFICAGTMMTGCSAVQVPYTGIPVYTIPNETPQRVHGKHFGRTKVSYRGVLTSPCTLNSTVRTCVE